MDPSWTRTDRQQLLAEMLAHFQQLDPLASPAVETAFLAPILAEGDFLNVSGEAGCGKTTLAADLLLGYAHSERKGSALGGLLQFNPVFYCSGNVGIVDAENAPPRWQSLLLRKMEAEGLDPLKLRRTIEYVRSADLELHREKDWSTRSPLLAEALNERGVRFAVIDTLGRTWAPDDINSTAWVQQGLAPFRSACQSYGITVVALTHTKRNDGGSRVEAVGPLGTSLQEAQADAQIIMTINSDGRGCRLKLRKSRRAFWIPPGTAVSLDFNSRCGFQPQLGWELLWPHDCTDEKSPDASACGVREQVLDLLRTVPAEGQKTTALAAVLGVSSRTINNHMAALEASGQVLREGQGPATLWRPAT